MTARKKVAKKATKKARRVRNERTSTPIGRLASKMLKALMPSKIGDDGEVWVGQNWRLRVVPFTVRDIRSVCGSVLTQRPNRKP